MVRQHPAQIPGSIQTDQLVQYRHNSYSNYGGGYGGYYGGGYGGVYGGLNYGYPGAYGYGVGDFQNSSNPMLCRKANACQPLRSLCNSTEIF